MEILVWHQIVEQLVKETHNRPTDCHRDELQGCMNMSTVIRYSVSVINSLFSSRPQWLNEFLLIRKKLISII